MPTNQKISDLTIVNPDGTEYVEVIVSPYTTGSNKRVTTQSIADLGGGGGTVPDADATTKGIAKLYPSTSLGNNTDGAPDQNAVKTYVDAQVSTEVTNRNSAIAAATVGLWDDRGTFSAAGGAYPSSGGSGTADAILKGDIWTISVAGTLPTGQVVEVGDTVRALIDTPGNTQANWAILQNNVGYVPENVANKATSFGTINNTLYPSVQAVNDKLRDLRTVTGADSSVQTDDNKLIILNSASAFNFTLDQLTAATKITFINYGAGAVTFVNGSGVTAAGSLTIPGAVGNIYYSALVIYDTLTTPRVINGASAQYDTLDFVIEGLAGAILYRQIPFTCTIVSCTLVSDVSGSAVYDLWLDTYANFPPTVADTIVASAKPTLSSAVNSKDTTLTGWSKALTKGYWMAIKCDSASTLQKCTLSLEVLKS